MIINITGSPGIGKTYLLNYCLINITIGIVKVTLGSVNLNVKNIIYFHKYKRFEIRYKGFV